MDKIIGYLGPAGTFCQLAVEKYFCQEKCQEKYILKPYQSIQKVFASVHSGEADLGVVPMENSCEGTVNQTLDLLAYGFPCGPEGEFCEYDLKIAGEIIIPIKHSLLAKPEVKLEEVSTIVSHPQAIAQCRHYLMKALPQARLVEVSSTAEAVKNVAQSAEPWAAIAMANNAQKYGLKVLASQINDYTSNETRFIIISKKEKECLIDCKTSILVNIPNEPGALYQALKEFSLRGINLTKIESRPAKTRIGQYLFFIDLDGHYLEPRIKEALDEIHSAINPVKILGSYKSAMNNTGRKSELTLSLDYLRREVDIIDEQIIDLLARRTRLVEQIGSYKSSAANVHDPKREEWILDRLSALAEEKGFSPAVTVKIYKILFEYFVALQREKKAE